MTPQTVESRVESLEKRVTNLEECVGLPDPAESPILPLRTQMRDGFSALRADIERLDGKVSALDGKVSDVQTHMRVLHEDVIERLKLLQEGRASKPAKGVARQ